MKPKRMKILHVSASRNIPVSELINRWVDSELNAEV